MAGEPGTFLLVDCVSWRPHDVQGTSACRTAARNSVQVMVAVSPN